MYLVLPTTAAEVVRDASLVGADFCQVDEAQLNNYTNTDFSKTTSAEPIAQLEELGADFSNVEPVYVYLLQNVDYMGNGITAEQLINEIEISCFPATTAATTAAPTLTSSISPDIESTSAGVSTSLTQAIVVLSFGVFLF